MTPIAFNALATLALLMVLTRELSGGAFVLPRVMIFFIRQKAMLKSVGGLWFGVVGSPLAAWFLCVFFIFPLAGINVSTLNINTVLQFANPTAVIIFLALWLAITFGFFGGTALYKRNGSK